MRRPFLGGRAVFVRLTTVCIVGLSWVLIAACTSCRNDTVNSPAGASSNTTAALPVTTADEDAGVDPPADPNNADPPADPNNADPPAEPNNADPLAGMDPELLAQLAEAEAAAAAEEQVGMCGTCHVDVVDDFAGSLHQAEDVGCVECHGPSEGHVEDENNEVKPEEVFARADVDRLCGECHRCPDPAAKREPGPGEKHKVCIDCHGPHKEDPPPAAAKDRPKESPG